ncbi:hypothetical protein [Mycobacterium angelicum]|uniref:Uncharacterized protein n=1 Tax=Mycobacterium angelicum TaxID=470074 RepID=A0A1W9ZF12_MYCAN|nr:hypothetical protein [Mycobacterium angelicum]MCV7198427.1 hypothetical protein [Mycobacterium angelicum]ORA13745.1 hypothetical protein BST12_23650 [Mycobacterium angelicum]
MTDIWTTVAAEAKRSPTTSPLGWTVKAGFNFDKFATGQLAKHRGPDPAARERCCLCCWP